MSDMENAGRCERCGGEIYGHLGVVDRTVFGVAVVVISEISPRNWICCDACAVTVCHACCQKPKSGYCDDCLSRITSGEHGGQTC